jgi:hypothetical protein
MIRYLRAGAHGTCTTELRASSLSARHVPTIAFGAVVALGLLLSPSSFAAILDLTAVNSEGTINGAIYQQTDPSSTGTGVFNAFVQLSPSGNNDTAHGYNTTVNNILNNGSSDQHNHAITLAEVPLVVVDNALYRAFLLDINESSGGTNEFISLDDVQVFAGGGANLNVTTFGNVHGAGVLDHPGTLVYHMDAVADSFVMLNYDLNTGSGSGDMYLYVPNINFAGFLPSDQVVLYSAFGGQEANLPGYGATAGFEEWGIPAGLPNSIPEPTTWTIAAIGLVAAWRFRGRT